MLDGTRNRQQLLDEIRHVVAGEVTAAQLERKLDELANMAVLVA